MRIRTSIVYPSVLQFSAFIDYPLLCCATHKKKEMSALAKANSVDETIDALISKIQVKDVAIQQLKERCELMQGDYEHNYHLLQSQAVELHSIKTKCGVQEKQIRQLEIRCAAQAAKLKEAEGEVHRQTQSLQSVVESLRGQLLVSQTEHSNLQRKFADQELELASLRQEMHQQSGKISRNAETVRREVLMETETLMREKERVLRVREDQLVRDTAALESKCLELTSEVQRLREAKETTDFRIEEMTKVIARKDFLYQQSQEQINDMKKSHAQQLSKYELDAQASSAMKDQMDRAFNAQFLSLQKDLDRRTHDCELMEQKVSAQRQQQELELRRKSEERDELIRSFEDKLRVLHDKVRQLEARESSAQEEVERFRKRASEGKKMSNQFQASTTVLEDRVEDLQRMLTTKETEIGRLHGEIERLNALTLKKEKEADELRAEFERRSWQDRIAEEAAFEKKRLEWRKHGASRISIDHSAANNNPESSFQQQGNSTAYNIPQSAQSPIPPQQGGISPYPSTNNANSLAVDVRNQMAQQQQLSFAAPSFNNASQSFVLQELALIKEQHLIDKSNLERKLQDAQRALRRHKTSSFFDDDGEESRNPSAYRSAAAGGQENSFTDGRPPKYVSSSVDHLNVSDDRATQQQQRSEGGGKPSTPTGLRDSAIGANQLRVEQLQKQFAESPLGK